MFEVKKNLVEMGGGDESYDVIVIGAGAAGLVAANMLTKEKFSVKLLEGSGLLGGRMYSREGLFE